MISSSSNVNLLCFDISLNGCHHQPYFPAKIKAAWIEWQTLLDQVVFYYRLLCQTKGAYSAISCANNSSLDARVHLQHALQGIPG